MKPGERKRIAKAIKMAIPNLQESGRMLFMMPLGSILRGFYIEDSSLPDAAYLWVFVQPLYVPSTSAVFTLGKRIGGPSRAWKSTEDLSTVGVLAAHDGLPFLQQVMSSSALADWPVLAEKKGEHLTQIRAYALGASGRWTEAIPLLESLAESLEGSSGWMHEMKCRAQQLSTAARTSPDKARGMLEEWQRETVKNLKLGLYA